MSNAGRILLVDDSPLDAELVTEALAELKIETDLLHLRDGASALDYLHRRGRFAGRQSDQPVVVFLDLNLPLMDGFQVLEGIKGDPHLKRIPVVMITGSREPHDVRRSYELGVNSLLLKPVELDDFLARIRSAAAMWTIINVPPPLRAVTGE